MSGATSKTFPESAESVVATLSTIFRHQKNQIACDVLENARARMEETGYDNWDGGTTLFTLFLEVPPKVFAVIEPEVPRIEGACLEMLTKVLRNTNSSWIRGVTITPIIKQPNSEANVVPDVKVQHLWEPGRLRIFLSHVAAHKVAVSKLKQELDRFGASAFVAHQDIEPTFEWQHEIELALQSMHSLVALVTPDFHGRKWTDQEVGYALGKGVLVIPVMLGAAPDGFIGKVQGVPGSLDSPDTLATGIVDLLLKHSGTESLMRETLVSALEKSPSFATSKRVTSKLEGLDHFSTEQLNRLEAACKSNYQVEAAISVPQRIAKVVQKFKPVVKDIPF